MSDDYPLAPAQLDYTHSPEPEQAITAPSLAAQHLTQAHTSETAVPEQHADSGCHNGSPDCHLEEGHADQTNGSSADQDSAHFIINQVAADQADSKEEVGDVEEEKYEEQDGAAEQEEYEQQTEPAQDPASCDADYDHNGDGSAGDEEHHQEGSHAV